MEEFKQRRVKFDEYLKKNQIKLSDGIKKFTCPCCGFPTLNERGGYEICVLCKWEDDYQDDKDANEVLGGPNGKLSLTQARKNFQKYLLCDGKESPDKDAPYKIVKNELIELFYELLDNKYSSKQIIKKIDNCFKNHYSILKKEIKKYEESLKNTSRPQH